MPLTVRVDPDLQVIFVSGEGVVTDADLLQYVAEYLSGGELHGYDELFDLTEADLLDLTYTGLAKTAAAAAATDPEAASVKIALLVSEIRGMGITRLYQSLRQSKGGRRETRVFTDAAECREWLGLNP
jgi:hypothetical protein